MSPWERDGVRLSDEWAAIVFPRVFKIDGSAREETVLPQGYVFVIVPTLRDPKYKLPGGKKNPGETPLATAVRELAGETGLKMKSEAFRYVGAAWVSRTKHWSILFTVDLNEDDVSWMHTQHPENEGEIPRYFSIEEFYKMVREGGFLPYHFRRLEEKGLILPLGRATG